MEKHMSDHNQASSGWWVDNHNRSHHSQWLQSTLTELDRKTKMILDIIEDNGDTFAKRAEMYYQKRPQLIKMVQDLHKSYRVLADKYDQLRSESLGSSNNIASLSNSFRQFQHHHRLEDREKQNTALDLPEAAHSNSGPIAEDPDSDESESANSDLVEYFNSLLHSITLADSTNKPKDKIDHDRNLSNGSILNNKNAGVDSRKSCGLELEKLMEDSLCQQAELIRRNDEKRETIKEMGLQIDRLTEENRELKSKLGSQKKKSRTAKFKFSLFR